MFLIVTRNFPPDIGGMQSLMGGLSEALLNHGPVKVFADEFPSSDSYDKKSTMNIQRVKGIKLFRKYRKANLVNNFINENNNIRAIFADHWKSLELLDRNLLKKYKIICLLHSKEINHKKGTNLNKRLIKSTDKANLIVANSNFTKNLAIDVGINSKKINVIFPGVHKPKNIEDKFINEANNLFGASFPKIITVARLDKRKGHDKIIMTIKNLTNKFSKIKYISIGSGDEEKNLLNLSKELSIENKVTFLKNIDENLKLALIKSSDLFLMPSVIDKKSVEGFGIAYMEAASYGVGSIGGKDGGTSDSISQNHTGLLCDGNELSSIHESVIEFFNNDNFIKFGKSALKHSENFHWDKVVKKYLNLINN
tara:strand:+ start:21 stop:1121 length:1101 start_codon:yes stop_codon:yes gene_type:complete